MPGHAYLAPDEKHLMVTARGRIRLGDGPPVGGHRPSATALLQSAAEEYGSRVVGVLLTGMGRDGAKGMKAIQAAGGRTLAQDEASCAVYGMPGAAVELDAVDEVAPIKRIGGRLETRPKSPVC